MQPSPAQALFAVPSQHSGGAGPHPGTLGLARGSRVLVTQRTMREAPEAPRVARLLQRKREESVTHSTAPCTCSHPHTPLPITAHAAPLTPTIARAHTGTAHVVPLTSSRWQGAPSSTLTRACTHTRAHTHTHTGCTPTGYPPAHAHGVPSGTHPQAHTPAHTDMDGCRWTSVAHAQPCTHTHPHAHTPLYTHSPW